MKVKVYVVFFAAKHSNEQQIDFIFTDKKQAQDYVDKQNKKKIKSITGVTKEDVDFGDDIQLWYEQEILIVKDDPVMFIFTNEKQAQDYVDKQNKKKIKSIAGVTREDIKFGDDIQFWYEQEILVVKDDPIMNVMDHLFG